MQNLRLALCLCLFPASVAAQEACPANIQSGNWDAAIEGIGTGSVDIPNLQNFIQSQAVAGRGTAEVDASACDGTFVVGMPQFNVTMRSVTTDPTGNLFEGSAISGGMTYDIQLQRLSDSELSGGFEASMNVQGIGINVLATGLSLQHQPNQAFMPKACICRSHLEAFLARLIASAQQYKNAFSNQAWRQRPQSWPADPDPSLRLWTVKTYRRVIDLIVLGYSPQQAYDRVWENTNFMGDQDSEPDYQPQSTPTGSGGGGGADSGAVEYESVQLAYVDGECVLHEGNAYESSCYPEIERESTIVHETTHVNDCLAGQLDTSINAFANAEVRAYTIEILWLESWIPRNCPA